MEPDEGCVGKLKVLAAAVRLSVLRLLLRHEPLNVGEMAARLGVGQSLLSHHLRALRDAGLVTAHRDGKAVTYRIAAGVRPAGDAAVIDLGCCRIAFGPENDP